MSAMAARGGMTVGHVAIPAPRPAPPALPAATALTMAEERGVGFCFGNSLTMAEERGVGAGNGNTSSRERKPEPKGTSLTMAADRGVGVGVSDERSSSGSVWCCWLCC